MRSTRRRHLACCRRVPQVALKAAPRQDD